MRFAILIPDSWFRAKHEWESRVFLSSKCRIPFYADYSYKMCLKTRFWKTQSMCCKIIDIQKWIFNALTTLATYDALWYNKMYYDYKTSYQVCLFIVVKHVMKNSLILKPFDFHDRSNCVLYTVWNWLWISLGGFFWVFGDAVDWGNKLPRHLVSQSDELRCLNTGN